MTYLKVKTRPYTGNYNVLQNFLSPFAGLDTNALHPSGDVPVNIYDGDSAYQVEVIAPGLAKEDFKLSLEKNMLTVSTELKEEEGEQRTGIRQEYRPVSFKRSFTLDEQVDTEKISAQYNAGILQIKLQKRANVTPVPKQITIE